MGKYDMAGMEVRVAKERGFDQLNVIADGIHIVSLIFSSGPEAKLVTVSPSPSWLIESLGGSKEKLEVGPIRDRDNIRITLPDKPSQDQGQAAELWYR